MNERKRKMKTEEKLRQLANRTAPDNFDQTAEVSGLGEKQDKGVNKHFSKIGTVAAALAVCLVIGVGTLVGPNLKNIAGSGDNGEDEVQTSETIMTTGNGYLDTAIRGYFALPSSAGISTQMLSEITSIQICRDKCSDIYEACDENFAASGEKIIVYIVNGVPVKLLSPIYGTEVFYEISSNLGDSVAEKKFRAFYLIFDEQKMAELNDETRRDVIMIHNPNIYRYVEFLPAGTEFCQLDPLATDREIGHLMKAVSNYTERSQYFRISSDITEIPDIGLEYLPNLTEFAFTPDTESEYDVELGYSALTDEEKAKYEEKIKVQSEEGFEALVAEQTAKAIEAAGGKSISEAVADGTLDENFAMDINGDGVIDSYLYDEYIDAQQQ